ncbi:hypothetical protein [Actinoalloteichus caeruleus]|uniref:hypothetical protein n=2 Tax=Actinoalloteichus cyanogriseus TaxID=2893586 RepID=UPI0004C23BBB|nr:hypothetical protein [Actinoalloteichus caeruleus]
MVEVASKRVWALVGATVLGVGVIVMDQSGDGAAHQERRLRPLFGSPCEYEVVAGHSPVRAGPAHDEPTIGGLDRGVVTGTQETVENGFRKLGNGRWIDDGDLRHVSGELCR